jgi:drug/metabolite transporter (DMT)-like permease
MSILYIGIFSSLMAFILWNKAISIIGAVNAGIVYYSLPIFSGVLAVLILDESISLLHLYSTLLVLAGILLAVVYRPSKRA